MSKFHMKNLDFVLKKKYRFFCRQKISKIFRTKKKIFFFEVETKIGCSFDAEKAKLSIGGIFEAIRAAQTALEMDLVKNVF